jgi:Sulfotransferase domain
MRVVANSVPKSGTHLLVRLLTLLGVNLVDFGGIAPHLVKGDRFPSASRRLRKLFGLRQLENVMGIGPHLVEGGRFPLARRFLRARGPEKVTIGIDFPKHIDRRWLSRRLSQVPDGCFITAHCIYTPQLAELLGEEQKLRVVCILRDPRDVAVSQMHYIKQRTQHFAHEEFLALPSDHERLLFSIRGGELGGRKLQSLDERYRQFLGWERDPNALMVKFEELVGSRGGGSTEAQRRTVERVAEHVGLGVDERTMGVVEEELFGVGRTFRKGQSGGWRLEFEEEHVRAAKEVAGPLLMELGYEASPDW